MRQKAIYALAMGIAGALSAGLGLAILGFRTDEGLFLIILPVAALSGATAGWIVPAALFRRFGHSRKWALVSGPACAFAGLLLGALGFFFVATILDGTLFSTPGPAIGVTLMGAIFAHVICGPFGYPLALLAGLFAHAASSRQTQEAAGDAPRRPPEQSED